MRSIEREKEREGGGESKRHADRQWPREKQHKEKVEDSEIEYERYTSIIVHLLHRNMRLFYSISL